MFSLGDLDHMAEEEDFLECAGGLEEDNGFSRQGLCSTVWPLEYTGRSNQRTRSYTLWKDRPFSQGPC